MDTTTVLRRKPLQIPETPAELLGEQDPRLAARVAFATQVKGDLGYTTLKTLVDGEVAADQLRRSKGSLARALASLNIEPFTPESVEAYKEQQLSKVRNEQKERWIRRAKIIFFLIGVASLITMLYGISEDEVVYAKYVVGGGAGLMLTVLAFMFMGPAKEWRWQMTPINHYHLPVPEAALRIAVDIKNACPAAVIKVEWLTDQPDPFLVPTLNDEAYHVGVWSEPNFTAQLE